MNALIATCLMIAALTQPSTAHERPSLEAYFTGEAGTPPGLLVTYTPSELDPRNPANQQRLSTKSIRDDLAALRTTFDGLVLYGYHEACTPRIVAIARKLRFRAVILGVWDIKSAAELDGVATLMDLYDRDLAMGVIVGNEGLTFGRYEEEDLSLAVERLQARIGRNISYTTSEPLVGYQRPVVQQFGKFVMPNIHPVFDRPDFGPEQAAQWVREEAAKLSKRTGKPVIVKETGFPHAGKPAYTPDSQRAFWQAYTQPGLLAKPGDGPFVSHGVAFEAFDLPWKAEESKLEIEKSWGLYSAKREPYPAVQVWQVVRAK